MLDDNMRSIVITRHGDHSKPLDEEMLQHWVEESEPETSATKRMLALVLLAALVAICAGLLGLILYLAQYM